MKKNDRVVIYTRVSTEGQNVSRQNEDLISFCEERGLTLVCVFSETISGLKDTKDRAELTNLMNFVSDKSNNIDGVIVTEISRLGRKLNDVSNNIELLNRQKIYVYSTTNKESTLNEDRTVNVYGNLVINIMASIGNMEREQFHQRTRSGVNRAMRNGQVAGRRSNIYGYDVKDKKYIVNEKEEKTIRDIYSMYLNGSGAKTISKWLNGNNVPTRYNTLGDESSEWYAGTVYRILTNEIYTGKRYYNEKNESGEIIIRHTVSHPQIIDLELFNEVQLKLKSHSLKIGKKNKYDYIFDTNIIKCSCGKNFLPQNRNGSESEKVYKCASCRKEQKCGNFSVNINKFSSSVWYIIRRTDTLLNNLKSSVKNNSVKNEIIIRESHILEINNELLAIDKIENLILEKLINGKVSSEKYDIQYAKLMNDKLILKNKISFAKREIKELKQFESKQINLDEQIRDIKGNISMMKKLINDLVHKIVIYPIYNFKMNNSNCVCVQLYLYTSINPIEYVITQLYNDYTIISLIKGEFDHSKKEIVREPNILLERKKDIIHKIEIGVK